MVFVGAVSDDPVSVPFTVLSGAGPLAYTGVPESVEAIALLALVVLALGALGVIATRHRRRAQR